MMKSEGSPIADQETVVSTGPPAVPKAVPETKDEIEQAEKAKAEKIEVSAIAAQNALDVCCRKALARLRDGAYQPKDDEEKERLAHLAKKMNSLASFLDSDLAFLAGVENAVKEAQPEVAPKIEGAPATLVFKNQQYERYEHHGNWVWVATPDKGQHREACLCYSCGNFKPGSPSNCAIANKVYSVCKQLGLVTPVWECPKFAPGEPSPAKTDTQADDKVTESSKKDEIERLNRKKLGLD